jgi:hypothetical protein
MIKKLIRCIRCNRVISPFGSLADLDDSSFLPGVEWSAEDLENQKDFFRCHQEHPIEELLVDPDTYVSDKPSYEPKKVSYFEASNGQQRFLVRRAKEGLDRPAFYQLIPGKLQVSNVSLKIQEEALRKQMSALNGSFLLPEEKIQKFIQAFQEEVESISPEKFAEEAETIQEGETSLLAYGKLKEAHWEKVLGRCQKDFQKDEMTQIKQFISENRQPNDVLSLLIKRKVSILAPMSELAISPFELLLS